MATEEKELSEVLIENAVSAFRTLVTELVNKVNNAEVDLDYIIENIDVDLDALADVVNYSSLADYIDCEEIAVNVDYQQVVSYLAYDELGAVIDMDLLSESLPTTEELDVIQRRQNQMYDVYDALKKHFAPEAAAPVDADGELK